MLSAAEAAATRAKTRVDLYMLRARVVKNVLSRRMECSEEMKSREHAREDGPFYLLFLRELGVRQGRVRPLHKIA